METGTIPLPTGTLSFRAEEGNRIALTDICGFGARHNPKRGFVFVSKVLGKHWPARPADMAVLHDALAQQIPVDDAGAMVFVGMAETATGLGHAVFEAFVRRPGAGRALYLQTTRYPLSGATPIEFQEEHSHATDQFLYLPEVEEHGDLLRRATTAVLIDDEATSGRTFVNLATALRAVCPSLRRLVPVVITDFTRGTLPATLGGVEGVEQVDPVSLWRGTHRFEKDADFTLTPVADAFAPVADRRAHVSDFTARLGLDRAITLPPAMVEHCASLLDARPVLVVGTGECMHPAFCLARELESGGRDVFVQSTTRSPLMRAGAITDITPVPDVYGEGIPNYLYNRAMTRDARVVIVHETGERDAIGRLVTDLDAIEFNLAERRVYAAPV